MIGLLTVAVLVLMGIAIWQINNIYQLIQNKLGNKKDNSQIANEKDNDLQGKLMFAFLVFIYIVTIYCFWAYSKVLLPEAASEHGVPYDRLLWISFAIILFAQTITQAFLHYFAYKYKHQEPSSNVRTSNNSTYFVGKILKKTNDKISILKDQTRDIKPRKS